MHRLLMIALTIALFATPGFAALSTATALTTTDALQAGDAERGEYIFNLAGGCGCHTGTAGFLAGGEEFGPFYASNITPDAETGIGEWSDQEIIDAIRIAKGLDGENLGVMPFDAFSNIADQDARDMVAYLRTVPAIQHEVPARTVEDVAPFEPEQAPPATAPTDGVARGDYIANALAHCGDCHTPANVAFMAGGAHPSFNFVPNITPDDETGIGTWTEAEMAEFLRTGVTPDGAQIAPGVMAGIIENSFSQWTEADALAVSAYLMTVPAAPLEAPAAEAAAAPEPDTAAEAPAEDTAADTAATLPETGATPGSSAPRGGLPALIGAVLLFIGFIMWRWFRVTSKK